MAYDLLAWKAWAANATTDEIAEMLTQKSEAVLVLAENACNFNRLWELERTGQKYSGDWLMADKHADESWREVWANPIAAEAVRKAGG